MHCNTYGETYVPIRTVLLPNALSIGASSRMIIYILYLYSLILVDGHVEEGWKQTTFSMNQSWALATISKSEYHHIQKFDPYGS